MKFLLRLSLIFSQVKAFVNMGPPVTTLTRCESKEKFTKLSTMDQVEKGVTDDKNKHGSSMGDIFNSPVSTPVEFVIEAIPLAIIGGMVYLNL